MTLTVLPQLASTGVATLTLNKPDKGNAFDDVMIKLMLTHLEAFMGNDAVRMIVLAAEGNHFSTGADLEWMKRMAQMPFAENRQDAAQLAKLMNTLWLCTKPVIAKVQGAAFGGALGLIACADVVVASDDSKFCLSEVRLGLAPAVISPYVTRAIGSRASGRYFLTGEEFDAKTALQLGLIHEVAPRTSLDERIFNVCRQLMRNGPHAMRATKTLLRRVQNKIDTPTIDYTTDMIAALRVSVEGQEGVNAFLEKRAPTWLGGKPKE